MDLSSVIASFATGTYTVTRRGTQSADTNGRVTSNSGSSLSISAVVTPVSGRDLQRLPEGFRTQELRSIFTTTELKTTDGSNEADVVSIDGALWQVQSVVPWSVLGNYWQAIAMRVGN